MGSTSAGTTETCGRCAAPAPADAELCPACGALLAAYRTPFSTPLDAPFAAPRPSAATEGAGAPPPEPLEPPVQPNGDAPPAVGPVEDPAVFDQARGDPPMALVEPERRLVRLAAAPQRVEWASASEPSATGPSREPEPPRLALPARRRAAPPGPISRPSPPRRPGFMVKGSVGVALLWGVGLVILGCFGLGIAMQVMDQPQMLLAFFSVAVAVLGAVVFVFAVLVTLVRRDRER